MKVNLVLSGGGARGIAHLGVVKSMLEKEISIRAISGTSAGALAGAFLAKGILPDEILEIALENSDFRFRRPPFSLGFFSKSNMEKVLARYFPENSFSELNIPLYVAATNINKASTEYFSSGELIKPLLASAALPIVFSAIEIDGSQYLDGGLLNNLPVEPFLEDELPVFGVHANPVGVHGHITSTFGIIERSIELAIYKNIQSRSKRCSLFIEPEGLLPFSVYDFVLAKEIYTIGYECGNEKIAAFLSQQGSQGL